MYFGKGITCIRVLSSSIAKGYFGLPVENILIWKEFPTTEKNAGNTLHSFRLVTCFNVMMFAFHVIGEAS